MKNPYIVECNGSNWNDITYYEVIPEDMKRFYKNGLWRHGTTREAAEYAKSEGFDGVIFKNITDNGGNNLNVSNKAVNVYVAFDSNQIKSATDNIGTFDTANDDIRFQASGIISYTEKEKDNWKKSHSIIIYESDNQFENFVDRVLENKDTEKKIYFGKISPSTAKFVLNKTGVDIENLNIALKGYEIRKILLNSHGDVKKENLRGQDIITIDDLKKIPFVVI